MFTTAFNYVRQWVAVIVGLIVLVLASATVYQKKRADRKEDEIDELEEQIATSEFNYVVKDFEAINRERKAYLDEDIKNSDDSTIEPNTTYSL